MRRGWKNGLAGGLLIVVGGLTACTEAQFVAQSSKDLGVTSAPADIPKTRYKVGKPYQIAGKWYYPAEDWDYRETGIASWYGPNFHGKLTANGEVYNQNDLTAAHRTLPLPSFVRVTNLENGRALVLRLNDRGPFAKNRIIDVSRRGAQLLGFERQGTARVKVEILRERSLALRAELIGEQQLAEEGTPITVEKVPSGPVAVAELPPLPGSNPAPAPRPPALRSSQVLQPVPAPAQAADAPPRPVAQVEEAVTFASVEPTQLFIQAGSFRNYQNALQTHTRLGAVGKSGISHALVGGRDFYRVRLGPVSSVPEADLLLEAVHSLGYEDAAIVVAEPGETAGPVGPGSSTIVR